MSVHSSPVRAAPCHDEPDADTCRIPAPFRCDLLCEAPLRVERPEHLLDFDDLRLELDDEERTRDWVPGEDVDHPALAVDPERDLGPRDPLGQSGEPLDDRLGQGSVPSVDEAIQVRRSGPGQQLDADVERSGHAPNDIDRHLPEMTPFDPRHDRVGNAGGPSKIALAPTTPQSGRPKGGSSAMRGRLSGLPIRTPVLYDVPRTRPEPVHGAGAQLPRAPWTTELAKVEESGRTVETGRLNVDAPETPHPTTCSGLCQFVTLHLVFWA